jgi:hypothetical protein
MGTIVVGPPWPIKPFAQGSRDRGNSKGHFWWYNVTVAADLLTIEHNLGLLREIIAEGQRQAEADHKIAHRPPLDQRQSSARRRSDVALALVLEAAELVLQGRVEDIDRAFELLEATCSIARTIEAEERALRR